MKSGDGHAADIQGGNNGVLLNGASFGHGLVGEAFAFDGINDYVQATTAGFPTGNSDRTLELWAAVDVFLTAQGFFAGYGTFGSLNQTYHLGTLFQQRPRHVYFSQWGASYYR